MGKLLFIVLLSLLLSAESFTQKKTKQKAGASSNLMGKMVTFKSGNTELHGYLSMPKKEGVVPGVILIHEWWGLNDWVKKNADQFAQKGYAALAVDLYRGKVTDNPDEAHEYSRALDQQQGVQDIIAAYNYLVKVNNVDSSNMGVIGWCMGGTYSLQSAINIPKVKASVVAYGGLSKDPETLGKINGSVLGIFGEEDKGIPPESVKEFEKVMKELDKDIRIYEYPKAGHAFMNEINKKAYNKPAADDAWKQIWTFFDENLKGGDKKGSDSKE